MAQVIFPPSVAKRRDCVPSISFAPGLERMPLLQLRDLAAYPGWESLHSRFYTVLDFRAGLQDAGRHGKLKFWGRGDKRGFPHSGTREPLRKIPKEHWSNFDIDILGLVLSVENMNVSTYAKDAGGTLGYVDLHLERDTAMEWLESEVNKYAARRR